MNVGLALPGLGGSPGCSLGRQGLCQLWELLGQNSEQIRNQKVRRGVHPARRANSPAGTSAEGEADWRPRYHNIMKAVAPTLLAYTHRVLPRLFLLLPVPLYQYSKLQGSVLPGVLYWESHKCPWRVRSRVQGGEKGKLGPHTVISPATSILPAPTSTGTGLPFC